MSPHEGCGCRRTTVLPSRRSVLADVRLRRDRAAVFRRPARPLNPPPTTSASCAWRSSEARIADFPFGAVIVARRKGAGARAAISGAPMAIRPRMARWSRSGASSTSIRPRRCAAPRSTPPANPARCAWARSCGATSAGWCLRRRSRSSPPRSTRSCCRARTSPRPRNSLRSRSPAACWPTRRWRCSK